MLKKLTLVWVRLLSRILLEYNQLYQIPLSLKLKPQELELLHSRMVCKSFIIISKFSSLAIPYRL